MCKRMKLVPYLIPFTKNNQKWINDLTIRPETITPRRKQREKAPWQQS